MKKIIEKAKDEPNIAAGLLTLSLSVLGMSEIKFCEWWHFILAFFVLAVLFFLFYFFIRKIVEIYTKYFERPDISVNLSNEFEQLRKNIHLLHSLWEQPLSKSDKYDEILQQEILMLCSLSIGKIDFITNHIKDNDSLGYFNTPENQKLIECYSNYCKEIKDEISKENNSSN